MEGFEVASMGEVNNDNNNTTSQVSRNHHRTKLFFDVPDKPATINEKKCEQSSVCESKNCPDASFRQPKLRTQPWPSAECNAEC